MRLLHPLTIREAREFCGFSRREINALRRYSPTLKAGPLGPPTTSLRLWLGLDTAHSIYNWAYNHADT
jgi:hypothetical protein